MQLTVCKIYIDVHAKVQTCIFVCLRGSVSANNFWKSWCLMQKHFSLKNLCAWVRVSVCVDVTHLWLTAFPLAVSEVNAKHHQHCCNRLTNDSIVRTFAPCIYLLTHLRANTHTHAYKIIAFIPKSVRVRAWWLNISLSSDFTLAWL